MPQPPLKKYPAEIFGYPYTNNSPKVTTIRQNQHCPFLNSECKKPRKSEPHIKIGLCSVGYRIGSSKKYEPVIICPHRFDLDVIFKNIIANEFSNLPQDEQIIWGAEVSLGVAGSVDYVAARVKGTPGTYQVEDFICIELQAAGTTGTPWQAFLEHQQTGKFKNNTYPYGINWANEFAKTMMQQAYKKGKVIEQWHKKIIFIIQDVGLTYLTHNYNTSDLRTATDSDSVYFYTFKMIWNDDLNQWDLQLDQKLSTDTEGIRKILAGQKKEKFLTINQFIKNIERKINK